MAKSLRRMTDYLGLTEPEEAIASAPVASEIARPQLKSVTSSPAPSVTVRPQVNSATLPGISTAAGLDRIVTLRPRFYNEARTVGEHFRQGYPVIINLSEMDDSERKRIIDFASGLVFGLSGSIERVDSKVSSSHRPM